MTKRIFDIFLSLLVGAISSGIIILIAFIIYMTSRGPVIYWSDRVGANNALFRMPKFRTMQVGTPIVATDLLSNPAIYLTSFGSFLRKTSLDELPQLWSILIGDMSFVGPRPALFNQSELISLRNNCGIDTLVPGLTGWAQVNGRDELPVVLKVHYEVEYLNKQSFLFDLRIIGLTVIKVFQRAGITH